MIWLRIAALTAAMTLCAALSVVALIVTAGAVG